MAANLTTQDATPLETPERPYLARDAVRMAADGRPVLVGGICENCGTPMFPRAPVCPSCMSEAVTPAEMPRAGTLYSFTVVHAGPKKWRKPMGVGYVDLPNGVRVFTHLNGSGFALDQPVELAMGVVGADADGPITSFVFQRPEA